MTPNDRGGRLGNEARDRGERAGVPPRETARRMASIAGRDVANRGTLPPPTNQLIDTPRFFDSYDVNC